MYGPDDILWGSAPGQGPELRNAIELETGHANRSWLGLWFFGAILLLFVILIPNFIAWDFISPRTFREFNYGTHPVFVPKYRCPRPLSWTNTPRTEATRARSTHNLRGSEYGLASSYHAPASPVSPRDSRP